MNPSNKLSLEALDNKNATIQTLVLDDETGVLNAIKRQLHGLPIKLVTCTSTDEARTLLDHYTIDVAFVDHQLGGSETGLNFLTEMSEDYPNCFRVIFTGESDFTFAVTAINNGHIDAFLPKPWSEEQLHALIRQGGSSSHLRSLNAALTEELSQRNFELECLNKNLEDIVASRTEELAETNRQLHIYRDDTIRLETQAAISQLVRGLAHELNNPLGIILGHAQRLKRTHGGDIKTKDCMEVIETEIERCRKLVERLRHYAQTDDSVSERCRIHDICSETHNRLEQRGFRVIDIRIEPNIPAFRANLRVFARAFDQLFENAILSRATEIHISHEILHKRLIIHVDNNGLTPSNDEVRNGVKPFYSTRTNATGLGLSVASALLAEMGCSLNFITCPNGKGARCSITMAMPESDEVESSKVALLTNQQRMLVLEDEPLITELIMETCNEMQIPASTSATISEAKDTLKNQQISCCVIDARLPDGSGCAFIHQLMIEHPHLKDHIALITGDPSQQAVIDVHNRYHCPILGKPFNMSDLNALIRSIT